MMRDTGTPSGLAAHLLVAVLIAAATTLFVLAFGGSLGGCDASPPPAAADAITPDAGADAIACDPDASDTDLSNCLCYCLRKYPGAPVSYCLPLCPDAGR